MGKPKMYKPVMIGEMLFNREAQGPLILQAFLVLSEIVILVTVFPETLKIQFV